MSAFEEMRRDGRVGEQTVELFVWSVSAAVRRHRYPPPTGSAAWTHAVCLEWVIDLFDKKGHDVAVRLFVHAVDQISFAKLVRRTVENELKDQAKATTAGKLRGRMRTLLGKEAGFVDATSLFGGDPAWTLEGFGDAIYLGDWADLLYAPALKLIEPIRELNTAGPTSKENADKLVTAARVILTEAGGAVRDQVLATALVKLFELEVAEMFLGTDGNTMAAIEGSARSPEQQVEAIEAGDRMIMELSTDELRGLLVLEESDAVAAVLMPHIPNIQDFLEALRVKLQNLIGTDGVPLGTLTHVLNYARHLPDVH